MMEKSSLSASLLSHFVTRLRAAEVVFDPFPHYYLEHVLPTEYYQALLRHLPTSAVYETLFEVTTNKQDNFRYRDQRDFNEGWTKNLPAELREFWDSFDEWFLRPELAQAVLKPFTEPLNARFGEGTPWPMFSAQCMLVRHRAGYFLQPHSDLPTKVAALLLYLAPDESVLHLGTSLYRPKDRGFGSPDGKHLPFEDFVRVKTAPYKPNSLLAFMRSDISFHGVEPLSEQDVAASCERGVIEYVIYDKKAREEELRARRLAANNEAIA
jgi:hypothetical protein